MPAVGLMGVSRDCAGPLLASSAPPGTAGWQQAICLAPDTHNRLQLQAGRMVSCRVWLVGLAQDITHTVGECVALAWKRRCQLASILSQTRADSKVLVRVPPHTTPPNHPVCVAGCTCWLQVPTDAAGAPLGPGLAPPQDSPLRAALTVCILQLASQILVSRPHHFPACIPPDAVEAVRALCAAALSRPLDWAAQSVVHTRDLCLTTVCTAIARRSYLALPYVRLLVSAPPQPQHVHARGMAALLFRLALLRVEGGGGGAAVMHALRVLLVHTGAFDWCWGWVGGKGLPHS